MAHKRYSVVVKYNAFVPSMIKYLHVLINVVLKYQSVIFDIIPLKRMVIPCTLVAPLYIETIFHPAAAAKSRQSYPTRCDPVDGTQQASPSLGFSRQGYWSGLPIHLRQNNQNSK